MGKNKGFIVKASTRYSVRCFDENGKLKWEEGFDNLVVTAGLNKLLDATFKTGIVSPAWFVGLKNSASGQLAADTMLSHAGWTEGTPYSNSTRPAFVAGSVSSASLSNSGSVASFSINNSDTLYGAFLVDDDAKGGTGGTLYGVGDFTLPRAVISGDTVEITVTLLQTAS